MATSDTFKYLQDNTQSNPQNAAQDFLDKKMAKNKYMSTSDPSNPYSMGEGSTPGGEAYEMDRKVLNQDAIDAAKAKNEGSGGGEGKLSSEQIRDKFGLEYSEEHEATGAKNTTDWGGDESTGAVYNRHTGEYIGTIPGYGRKDSGGGSSGEMRQDAGIGSFEAIEKYGIEKGLTKQRNRWSSINDVAGAATDIHGESTEVPEPVLEEIKPIEHSEEIKQAKDRVQQYETDVMSGKTSEEIFGKGEAMADDQYVFDATKGAEGIGTSSTSASSQDASKATASFLNNKVGDVKSKFNLQPQ